MLGHGSLVWACDDCSSCRRRRPHNGNYLFLLFHWRPTGEPEGVDGSRTIAAVDGDAHGMIIASGATHKHPMTLTTAGTTIITIVKHIR